ncbi:MAG: thiamine biosynthesis protein [Deltaproteobacteria bacterium]|nr:thiamine biosynthesis protein [Deltaproteobacteria bacterium]
MIPHITTTPQVVALFSQGLDSILATRVIQQQGLTVQAVKFISPFFGYEIKGCEPEFCRQIKKSYDIDLTVIDLSDSYLTMLAAPQYGYGKNFNPCLDCKIMMLNQARSLAEAWGAKAIITGEVVGQRPFSQRRDTMRRIEKLSLCEGLLLRPLSAKLLPPSQAEECGLIKRELLFDFSGRGRKPQIALAQQLNITDYPNPAGGCLLTDPGFAKRVKTLYQGPLQPSLSELNLLKFGRFYPLENFSGFVMIGRHKEDNQQLLITAARNHYILHLPEMAGPVAVLKGEEKDLAFAAEKLCRHSKARGMTAVKVNWRRENESGTLTVTI